MTEIPFQKLVRPEPIVRADAVLNVTFGRRDVRTMCSFLEDFGFISCEPAGDIVHLRGHGEAPYLVSVRASAHDTFIGFALAARSADDLYVLAKATGAAVDRVEGPGGGLRVRLTDPDGLEVDFVHGFDRAPALATHESVSPINTAHRKPRLNATVRRALAPSPIFKVGHVVLQRPDFDRAAHWYMRHFGIIPSDVQCLPDGRPALGFFRLDRGPEPADHHTLALLGGPGTKLLHVAFETLDLDSVGQGNQFLRMRGWTHHWGIGRHVLGSQVFDYWKDPVGDEWEHYTDGDVMNADYPTGYVALTRGSLWAWGEDIPDSMRPDISPGDIKKIHAAGGFGEIELSRVEGLMNALSIAPRPWLR